MENQNLIYRTIKNKKEFVQLTQFGILVLFYFLYEEFIQKDRESEEKYFEPELEFKINKIVTNNQTVFSIIFLNWGLLKKVLSIREITGMFDQIFFRSDIKNLIPDYREEEIVILNTFESMQRANQNKIRKEFSYALEVCIKWGKRRKCQIPIVEKAPSFGHLEYTVTKFLRVPTKFLKKNTKNKELLDEIEKMSSIRSLLQELVKLDRMTFPPGSMMDTKFEEALEKNKEFQALENRILFQFFTIFRAWHPQKFNILLESDQSGQIFVGIMDGLRT